MTDKGSKRHTYRFGRTLDGKPYVIKQEKEHGEMEGGAGKNIHFRPPRYRVSALSGILLEARVRQPDGSFCSVPLYDLCANGISIIPRSDLVLRLGETLPEVIVLYNNNEGYRGSAGVVSMREIEGETVVGLSLLDDLLDLGDILDLTDVMRGGRTLADEIQRMGAQWEYDGAENFKAHVAEFRLFLEDVHEAFNKFEEKMPWYIFHDSTSSPAQQEMHEMLVEGPLKTFLEYLKKIDTARRMIPIQYDGRMKEFSKRYLHNYILQGPLFARAWAKPLRYAGDYATMAYIYYRHNEGRTPFARFMHLGACHADASKAVRNRKDLMKWKMEEMIAEKAKEGKGVKILSIGAGPAQEFYELFSSMNHDIPKCNVILFDVEEEALNYCFLRLNQIISERKLRNTVELSLLYYSVKQLLFDDSVVKGRGPFDLILCAGLYDYLQPDKADPLTKKLFAELAHGGTLLIGNMAPENPSRWIMEHLLDWNLIYRTESELLKLGECVASESSLKVISEPLRINLFLEITKQ